ncbi:MAG: DEAD/DEAH box helicase [bacterium]|nr:DEAD/DEAH box helicase [bacterium]
MKIKTFEELKLSEPIARALQARKYLVPTPIQAEAIPPLLAGRDLIGCAQTGTGKTAAFALPLLQKMTTDPKRARPGSARVLVLTPTRELAAQVGESFRAYGQYLRLSHALVYGGVSQVPQVKALSRGVDVLVATPGRLLDLMEQRRLNLSDIEFFVLDEADRMLDMGFLPDIRKIIASLPKKRQALLFSATMAPEIRRLAQELLTDPVNISVAPPASTAEKVNEQLFFVEQENKRALLADILKTEEVKRALVFTRTKHGANRLVQHLGNEACAIHGNKSQSARLAALKDFRNGRYRVLVATDVASRGIDVTGITHVINYDMPNEAESYVHRIGRTARAGAAGTAVSFCGSGEHAYLKEIERLLRRSVPVLKNHPYHSAQAFGLMSQGKTAPSASRHKKHFSRPEGRSDRKPFWQRKKNNGSGSRPSFSR